MATWPEDRADIYDADKYWDEVNATWASSYASGGGRYVQQLVVVGEDGDIYFGDL